MLYYSLWGYICGHAFALGSDNTFLELKAIWRHLSFGSGALALLCWKSLNKVWIWTGYWRAVICTSKGSVGSGGFRAWVMDLDRPKPSLAAGARKCEETEMGKLCSEQWIEVLHGVEVLRTQRRWWRRKVESLFFVTGQGKRRGFGSLHVWYLWGHTLAFTARVLKRQPRSRTTTPAGLGVGRCPGVPFSH